ncbi:MAG: bifunctional [glutamate--ammonia ligase]-adenylyl-L-tyrosine phosphorylase/[glutamate--ammonia-ligase] adenylyltransferase, partial [Methylococcaceae bacterium]|nr:bifunctional [glutamate--ammonia ligase]-adenylyl-L-tyrosine phosphorylase/[glutamate--ammonia-ligase] adenylyltransferase [Methylococcaceae bacterium]
MMVFYISLPLPMSFINTLEPELDKLPVELRPPVAASLEQWHQQVAGLNLDFNPSPEITASMAKVWCSSLFIAESCMRRPEILVDLVATGDLSAAYNDHSYVDKLACMQIDSEAGLMQALRQFRRREMIRIAWRDLAGWAQLSETLAELSWLADACIQYALSFLYNQACEKRGTPLLSDGRPQQIIVLGMGKLGAYELNYSSDI